MRLTVDQNIDIDLYTWVENKQSETISTGYFQIITDIYEKAKISKG